MKAINPDETSRPVFVLREDYDPGEGPWHAHGRAQLIHASEGVLTVHTESGMWVVPPQRAVWVPPEVAHQVVSRKKFRLCTLYADAAYVQLPPVCQVVTVDKLVEQLLVAASEFGPDYPLGGPEERLIHVILDRLPTLAIAPLSLAQPRDPRLARIAQALALNPSDPRTLDEFASLVGTTTRTAARLFAKETGLSFSQWRQQLRLLTALERLGAGESVTRVALDVGYCDVSSFIAMFKAALGETPARYFQQP